MEKYVVSYCCEGRPNIEIMTGNELAKLIGFSDCYELKSVTVWKPIDHGYGYEDMIKCRVCPAMEPPYNRLYVEVLAGWTEEHWYEWDEH